MYVYHIFRRYKLDILDRTVFDPIRRKYVALTPEEKVRQQTIKFLMQRAKIPANRISIEKSLHQLGDTENRKRVDICIFDDANVPIAIVECKAYYIGAKEVPYLQAIDYVESLNIRNYFVVDGYEIYGFHYNKTQMQFEPLSQIPLYEELLRLQ